MSDLDAIDRLVRLHTAVKKLFDDYLDVTEESSHGRKFHPIHVSCCRAAHVEPLGKLLEEIKTLSGAKSVSKP